MCLLFATVQPKCIPDDYILAYEKKDVYDPLPQHIRTIQLSDLKSSRHYVLARFVGLVENLCQEFGDLTKDIEVVTVANSPIASVDKGIFDESHITNLILDDLQLTSINSGIYQNMSKLKHLYFNKSPIKTVKEGAFKNLPELTNFDLTDTEVQTINPKWFEKCPKITTVDFSKNKIRILYSGAFSFMTKDTPHRIYLMGNKIRTIEAGAFTSKQIELLQLEGNHLKSLGTDMFPQLGSGMKREIDLEGNRFTCIDDKTLALLKLFEHVNLKDNYPHDTCDRNKATRGLKNFSWT